MAYIAPSSVIRILKNVPLESDYINTIWFAGASSQTSYFQGKTKYTLNAQSYQRVNKGVCRVNYKAEDLYDCNYMMFQNTNFGTKWFYAFITSVDYINNVTSDIHYEIDVMQTWFHDMILTRCFVEREHSVTDNIGDNIVTEPVDLGELVFNDYAKFTTDLDTYNIVVAICDTDLVDPNTGVYEGGQLIEGVYSGARLKVFPATNAGIAGVNGVIDAYSQKPDAIVGIYMIPYASIGHVVPDAGEVITNRNSAYETIYTKAALTGNDTLDYYLPRNKKLYTYPYNFFHIDNANGRELNLRYEFFNDNYGAKNLTPQFLLSSNVCMPVVTVLRPRNYKGIDASGGNYNQVSCAESIDITGYPMCSWSVDSWTAWVAQNSVPEAISCLQTAGGIAVQGAALSLIPKVATATSAGIGLAATAGVALVNAVGSIVSQAYKASIRADICKGSLNNANINMADHKQNFFYGRVSVNRHIAAIIDDFFDRFGYATNRLKVPNIHSRPHWNYVKTMGSNIGGNIPADDKKLIDNIFNTGITFWNSGDEVDNYTLNNAPTSTP